MREKPARVSCRQPDIEELQARLNALPCKQANLLKTGIWYFYDEPNGKPYSIDFNVANWLYETYPNWVQAQNIDAVHLLKHIWLTIVEGKAVNTYKGVLNNLLVWIAAMAEYNLMVVTRESLPHIVKYRLTHTWTGSGILNLKSLISSARYYKLSVQVLHNACEEVGLRWFGHGFSPYQVNGVLKNLIQDLTDGELTYLDWNQGESYNLLTLDHGQYYVEHCLNLFEQHVPLALALNQTLLEYEQIAKAIKLAPGSVKIHMTQILQGFTAEEINSKEVNFLRRIETGVKEHFFSLYQQRLFEREILQESTLKHVINTFELEKSFENLDRMRVVIWNWLRKGDQKETQRLLNECQTPIPWQLFQKTLDKVKRRFTDQPLFLPTKAFFTSIGINPIVSIDGKRTGISATRQFINLVSKAGVTNIVALTGWRRSEFGWPFSAILQTRNTDKLDEYAFPHRYQIDWYIFKTNGKVRALREVTFSIVVMAENLMCLNDAENNDQPCLYSTKAQKKNPFESAKPIGMAVGALWPHFVHHYPGFTLIDDWESWQTIYKIEASGNLLSTLQKQERERLLSLRPAKEWDRLTIDGNLRETWRRIREEWPRIAFFRSKNSKESNWLMQYRYNTLRKDWRTMLDTHLSDETQKWLFSLSSNECTSNLTLGKTLMNEILGDALYPSVHAFRHMWAESVYRRFDGDAGWMIRSQFKHISRNMWLAYIRDKDNRTSHQRAKLQVTHSLVHNYIQHQGEGYAGQMNKLLRRLFRKTHVLSSRQQQELAEQFVTQEIENLKANPWGYCLLMRRTRRKARCMEDGEPMRHNASPELCLGCIHNLMQTTNVEWMLFQVAAHVEALNNPVVPDIFKQSSYELLRNTTRHVRTLNASHEALPELEIVLKNFQSRVA